MDQLKDKLAIAADGYDVPTFVSALLGTDHSQWNQILINLVKKDHYPFVSALGNAGIDFSGIAMPCFNAAVRNSSHMMLRVLCCDCGCNPNIYSATVLHKAAEVGWTRGVETLLNDCGLDPMADNGRAFIESSIRDYTTISEILLKKCPWYAKIQNSIGAYYAIINNNLPLLKLNIEKGARIGQRHLEAANFSNNETIINMVKNIVQQKENS